MMKILETNVFSDWLSKMKDKKGQAAILARINRARLGNFGDYKILRSGVQEMRIAVGAGYRVYYAQIESVTYILLCGGDKSTQSKDINKAIEILNHIRGNK